MKNVVLLLGLWICSYTISQASTNVVLITADDLGYQLSCYGESRFSTPNFDAFAKQGVLFSRAYVCQASCSASRASILTGLYPHQNRQVGLAQLGFHSKRTSNSLPSLLHNAGYLTGIIGKLHVEPAADYPFDWQPLNPKPNSTTATRDVAWTAGQCKEFFDQAHAQQKPFFLYLNFFDPHGPYTNAENQVNGIPDSPTTESEVTDPFPLPKYFEETRKPVSATIINCIRRLDHGMGLVLKQIAESGLENNTVVIFISDNGLPIIKGKTTCYEQGTRVPLIVRWPGVSNPDSRADQLVSEIDLYSTVLDAADVQVPDGIDAISLRAISSGQSSPGRELLFTEMHFHDPLTFAPTRTARDDRWKLILTLNPSDNQTRLELYDLQSDKDESTNLVDVPEHQVHVQRLETELSKWRAATHDPLLDSNRVTRWSKLSEQWRAIMQKTEPRPRFYILNDMDREYLDK
jgi:N-sulfoglucosamine sulfohydrolase